MYNYGSFKGLGLVVGRSISEYANLPHSVLETITEFSLNITHSEDWHENFVYLKV
jgi:hypothetical protein